MNNSICHESVKSLPGKKNYQRPAYGSVDFFTQAHHFFFLKQTPSFSKVIWTHNSFG